MRHTVSKFILNRHVGLSLPPRLIYWIDDTPSGWYSFPDDIFLVRCHYFNPFCHIHCPTSLMLLSRISSTAVSIPVVLHLRHHACLPLSSSLILSTIPIIPEQRYALRFGSQSLLIFSQSVTVLTTHFVISIVLHIICCRPTCPPPQYPSLLSCIYSTVHVCCCLRR